MAFKDFPEQEQGIQLLQRSLERGRLAHAYLFTGHEIGELEAIALTLARTLNCLQPVRARNGTAIDCCGQCPNCRKIEHGNHADVHWVRPESKSRVVTIEQIRDLMQEMNLKPTEAQYKIAIIVGADRLNVQAANAFLKTLEEPPARSILILLTSEPQRLLETILSRCLRLNFAGDGAGLAGTREPEWLARFGQTASTEQKSLLSRYQLLDVLLQELNQVRTSTEEALSARSPLQRYPDVEKETRDKWEDELSAAIEAEYRRLRADRLAVLQRWFRDVWLQTLRPSGDQPARKPAFATELLNFPQLESSSRLASRLTMSESTENLQILEKTQRLLNTNVQEALALEVGLLRLHL